MSVQQDCWAMYGPLVSDYWEVFLEIKTQRRIWMLC